MIVYFLQAPIVFCELPFGEIAVELTHHGSGHVWNRSCPVAELTHYVSIVGDHVPTHAAGPGLFRYFLCRSRASGKQIMVRDLLQFVNPASIQVEILQSCSCDCLLMLNALGRIGTAVVETTAALRDCPVKETLCRRHLHEASHLASASRLPEDRHISGIAAERFDIVANPLEGSH